MTATSEDVFPELPSPYDEVRERWVRSRPGPDARVEVAGPSGRLHLARDDQRLWHLGVRPSQRAEWSPYPVDVEYGR